MRERQIFTSLSSQTHVYLLCHRVCCPQCPFSPLYHLYIAALPTFLMLSLPRPPLLYNLCRHLDLPVCCRQPFNHCLRLQCLHNSVNHHNLWILILYSACQQHWHPNTLCITNSDFLAPTLFQSVPVSCGTLVREVNIWMGHKEQEQKGGQPPPPPDH